MKPHTLPVKRLPVSKGIFKRLSAVTGNRKQRVAATATPDMEFEDGSSKISRALTIIFLIHIVAIGLIFVHQKFLDGRAPEEAKTPLVVAQEHVPAVASTPARLDLPRLATGEKPYIVRQGDNYARIASSVGVEESDLRLINKHADIVPGLLLKIPPKRMVTVEPPEVAAIRNQEPVDHNSGLVPAVDVSSPSKARLVKPTLPHSAQVSPTGAAPAVASGKTYVVKKGDSVWLIANRFKVSQETLMKANGISKNHKIQPGMSLAIPR
jgi:LysM repeat protein